VHVGLVISVMLHAALLGWAMFTIQTQRELRVSEPEAVAVDFMNPSEVTKVRQGVRTAKQMDAEAKETPKAAEVPRKEAPKPTPVATPKPEPPKPEPPKEEVKEAPKPEPPKPEPPKEVAKVEPPKLPEPSTDPIAEKLAAERPDPAIEQAKKLEEERREAARKAEEQRIADEQKRAEDQKKREEDEKRRKEAELKKKKEDDEKRRKAAELKKKKDEEEKKRKEAEAKKKQENFVDEMQALLNKVPDKGAPLPNTPQETPSKNKGPVLGAKEGRDKELSATESARLVSLLNRRISECYRPPVGAAAGLEGLRVRLSFDLSREGSVVGTPRATGVDGAPVSRLAAEAAERAVLGCQPYDMLPPDKYEAWKGIDLNFNPKDLFGG
jgi:colicin import membrane protein